MIPRTWKARNYQTFEEAVDEMSEKDRAETMLVAERILADPLFLAGVQVTQMRSSGPRWPKYRARVNESLYIVFSVAESAPPALFRTVLFESVVNLTSQSPQEIEY